ncbi:hypothetical protein LINPERHAP2_LOCUS17899 [Linum perenne]
MESLSLENFSLPTYLSYMETFFSDKEPSSSGEAPNFHRKPFSAYFPIGLHKEDYNQDIQRSTIKLNYGHKFLNVRNSEGIAFIMVMVRVYVMVWKKRRKKEVHHAPITLPKEFNRQLIRNDGSSIKTSENSDLEPCEALMAAHLFYFSLLGNINSKPPFNIGFHSSTNTRTKGFGKHSFGVSPSFWPLSQSSPPEINSDLLPPSHLSSNHLTLLSQFQTFSKITMDSLLNQTTNLTLSRPERVLELAPFNMEDEQGGSFSLVGKMLTTKAISMSTIKGATRRPWSLAGSIDIKFLKDNTFIFTFSSEEIREFIWSKRSWVIADHLLALKKGDDYNNPDDVPFDTMDLWVQFHNLPAKYKSMENIKTVANNYFKYKEIDRAGLQPGTWHRFVRVWVEIDLREPLPNYFIIPTGAARERVDFVYEKVNELCKACARIGHTEFSCQEDPGSPFDFSGTARRTDYLRSPGDTSGESSRGTPSSEFTLQDKEKSSGYYPPTASSRTARPTDLRGMDSATPFSASPNFEDLFPRSKEQVYNSKGRKEAKGFICPRNLGLELENDGLGSGLRVEGAQSRLSFPPGFEPMMGQKSLSKEADLSANGPLINRPDDVFSTPVSFSQKVTSPSGTSVFNSDLQGAAMKKRKIVFKSMEESEGEEVVKQSEGFVPGTGDGSTLSRPKRAVKNKQKSERRAF